LQTLIQHKSILETRLYLRRVNELSASESAIVLAASGVIASKSNVTRNFLADVANLVEMDENAITVITKDPTAANSHVLLPLQAVQ
jgi:hypothetical protein